MAADKGLVIAADKYGKIKTLTQIVALSTLIVHYPLGTVITSYSIHYTKLYDIEEVYIPDLLAVAGYYKDWAAIGGTTNFLACGDFPTDEFDLNS